MAISFSNGMSINTSLSEVFFNNNANQEISRIGITGTSQPQLPFASVRYNASTTSMSYYPQNNYPNSPFGQSYFPVQVPANEPYYWNPRYFNRRTSEFVCPVYGKYRMTMNVLTTGNSYNRDGMQCYPVRNGISIGVNGAIVLGGASYATVQSVVVVVANGGDRLCWYANEGMRRGYSDTWSTFTYCLLA